MSEKYHAHASDKSQISLIEMLQAECVIPSEYPVTYSLHHSHSSLYHKILCILNCKCNYMQVIVMKIDCF